MRHFIVFYRGTYSSRTADESVFIYDDRHIESNDFPNKKEVLKQLREELDLRWANITNIIEVSEKELKNYYR